MSRTARVATLVLVLFSSFTASADLVTQSLRGHVWLDLTADGVYLRVDRHDSGGPDGRIDDEYFLMMRAGIVVQPETLDLGEGFVTSTPKSVTVIAPLTRTRYLLMLENTAAPSIEPPAPVWHAKQEAGEVINPPYSSPADSSSARLTALEGYGIRHSTINASRAEILADPTWQRSITADAQCDAGGGCFAEQCSITCAGGAGCSITCTGGSSACCRCYGPTDNKPSCSCVSC